MPDGLRDGLGGDDDRSEVIARVHERGSGGDALLAALKRAASAALRHGTAAECGHDREAAGTGQWDEHGRGIIRMSEERGGTARHEPQGEPGGQSREAGGMSTGGQATGAPTTGQGR